MALNISGPMTVLILPPLPIPPSARLPVLVFSTLTYLLIMFCNAMVSLSIAMNPNLHKPMYLLLINLPICDMMGATAFFPQMISTMLSDPRVTSYWECVIQALFIHVYGGAHTLILTVMALDRYVAICKPLSYNTIMTNSTVVKMICFVWITDFAILSTSILMVLRLTHCNNEINDVFCTNLSLMKLSCGDTRANNYFGLFNVAFFQITSLSVMLFTYAQILFTCFVKKESEAKRKAVQTCAPHLVVFLFFQLNSFAYFLGNRVETTTLDVRRALLVSVFVFPPLLNPLVYGINSKDIRANIVLIFKGKIRPY